MLQTGTVYGSPISAMGAENLGGLAFVQSIALLWLPIRAINGVDAILGLFLCLVPLLALGYQRPGLRLVAAVAIASTVIIDPYYVNTSALFLGAALIMAAVLVTSAGDRPGDAFSGGSPVAAGLLYAALLALKPTLLLFVGPHLAAVACTVAFVQASPRAGLRWGTLAAACTAGFLSPWVLVHLPHYLAPAVAVNAAHPSLLHNSLNLLDVEPIEPRITGLRAYTILTGVLAALAAACVGFERSPRWRSAGNAGAAVAALIAVAAYPVMLFVFPKLFGYADADPTAVRYFTPLALGIFPIALCAASQPLPAASAYSRRARLGLCVSLGLVALVGFSATAADRYSDALRYHTFLPYSGARDPVLARALDIALAADKQAQVRSLQQKIPPGSSLIAWIYTPYLLDYSRNTIFDTEIAGISNPWAVLPTADYMLWEYRGYKDLAARVRHAANNLPPVNTVRAAPMIAFERTLSEQLKTGTVVFRNEEFVLLRTASGGR